MKRVPKSDVELTKADFSNDQMVKWCPGCGDHAILSSVLGVFPKVGHKKENYCVVSGIGCSSRFPYYVNTYGFHSIHGRANAIATGVKIANPKLSVWVSTGDGDSMAIGGNHFIHVVRRNIDINIMLFNNEIYGLTKGQYSPTTKMGKVTKTSPFGTIEQPFNPGELVIGAQGTFFARALDVNVKLMGEVLLHAAEHDGASVTEILQNCVIFNDKTHKEITDKEVREDRTIVLEHGKPMIFGKDNNKGLVLDGFNLKVVTIGENGITEKDILVHDAKCEDNILHYKLATMGGDLPLALGVIRDYIAPTYDEDFEKQIEEVQAKNPIRTLKEYLLSGETWEVK